MKQCVWRVCVYKEWRWSNPNDACSAVSTSAKTGNTRKTKKKKQWARKKINSTLSSSAAATAAARIKLTTCCSVCVCVCVRAYTICNFFSSPTTKSLWEGYGCLLFSIFCPQGATGIYEYNMRMCMCIINIYIGATDISLLCSADKMHYRGFFSNNRFFPQTLRLFFLGHRCVCLYIIRPMEPSRVQLIFSLGSHHCIIYAVIHTPRDPTKNKI